MASNYTTHYGLCQWAPGDKFLREEFNQDNGKIDAGLRGVATTAAAATVTAATKATADAAVYTEKALTPVRYNVYNLMLQRYYEGHRTGFAKALVVGGCLDDGGWASRSQEIVLGGGKGRLDRVGQGTITRPASSNTVNLQDVSIATPNLVATGAGTLTKFSFQWHHRSPAALHGSILFAVNGKAIGVTSITYPTGNSNRTEITLSTPLQLAKGDTISLSVYRTNGAQGPFVYVAADGLLACTITIQPIGAPTGALTAKTVNLGEGWTKSTVYVRYAGGLVTPTLSGTALTRVGRRSTEHLGGGTCTEDTYTGNGGSGAVALRFAMDCGSDGACEFYDYGVVLS